MGNRGRGSWLDYQSSNGQFVDSTLLSVGEMNALAMVRNGQGVFFLTGNTRGPFSLADDLLTVEFPPYLGWRSIRVVDATGREVALFLNPDRQKVRLDLSYLAGGVYGLVLDTELLRITKKLILH